MLIVKYRRMGNGTINESSKTRNDEELLFLYTYFIALVKDTRKKLTTLRLMYSIIVCLRRRMQESYYNRILITIQWAICVRGLKIDSFSSYKCFVPFSSIIIDRLSSLIIEYEMNDFDERREST